MKLTLPLALLAAVTIPSVAQTTTTAKKSTTTAHRATTSAAKPAPAPEANPADNPPNVPKVEGTPKNLYALRYIDITIGTGEIAQSRRYYTVHYTGWLTDGTKFASAVDRKEPVEIKLGAGQVNKGWDEGDAGRV